MPLDEGYLFVMSSCCNLILIFCLKECYSLVMSSCNKFIHCFDGAEHTKTCPNGLTWNTIKNECDWPASTNCGARPTTIQVNKFFQKFLVDG